MKILVLDSTAVRSISEGPGSPAYFSRYVIDHLLNLGHEILISNDVSEAKLREADVVWSEWCNEIAFIAAALNTARKKFIIRMRGYDVWSQLVQMPWQNVHALVYESRFLRELAEEQVPDMRMRVECQIIPSGIDLNAIEYRHRTRRSETFRPVLALVARTTADKGYQLAFEYARRRPDIDLHVTTALGEHNPRLYRYLQHTKPGNVQIHDTVDTCIWLNTIGATHLLSCSIWETLGYTIAEGMAVGCKPLIHDGPGLGLNWPSQFLWRSFDDLDKLVGGDYYSPDYRRYVEQYLSAEKGSADFAKLVLG